MNSWMKRITLLLVTSLLSASLFGCIGNEGKQDKEEQVIFKETKVKEQVLDSSASSVTAEVEERIPLAENLIGVWESSGDCIAFTETEFFSLSKGILSSYTIDEENSTVVLSDVDDEMRITLKSEDYLMASGAIAGSYSKTDQDPATYMSENCVILFPGSEWSNSVVSVQVQQFAYADDDGFDTSYGSRFPTMTNQFCVECIIASLGDETIFSEGEFVINGKTKAPASVTAGFSINPFSYENTIFGYEVAPSALGSIEDIAVYFRYYQSGSNTKNYVTPLIIVRQ